MRLTSTAFPQGGKIPTRFTCDGADVSPPLSWSSPPKEAQSFALVCSDPDAPSGVWYHWAIFDVPQEPSGLAECCDTGAAGARQARNDFGKTGYGGPCPPRGHGRHHYHFKLFALNVPRLNLPATTGCRELEEATQSHAIATATSSASIRVRAGGASMADPDDKHDGDIMNAVRLPLKKDPMVDSDQIRVSTRNAVVMLQGQVTTGSEREAAEFDAWYVFGVDEVVNHILVTRKLPGAFSARL